MKQSLYVAVCAALILGVVGCFQVRTAKKSAGNAPYSISGHVQRGNTGGLGGVLFLFTGTGAPPSVASTNAAGNYTQGRFPAGTFIVRPIPTAAFEFIPTERAVNVNNAMTNVNFEAIPTGSSVTLLSPNGGEAFATGTTVNINWTTTATAQLGTNVILEYSVDGGATWNTITQTTAVTVATGTYPWAIPVTLVNEFNVRVRVTIADYPVLKSNSAGNFAISQAYKISGSIKKGTGGGLAGVRVDFSNGAPSVVTDSLGDFLATGFLPGSVTVTPNSSSYIFTPPTQTATITTTDVVLPDFTATPSGASLTVTAPTGGANLLPNAPASIIFTAANLAGTNAIVEYSPDNGATWITLAASISVVDGANSVVWTTPAVATTQGLIRVSSLDYPLAVPPAVSGVFNVLSLYSLSGSITAGGLPLSGVSLTFSGTNAPPPTSTDAAGDYSTNNFIPGVYTVIPSLAGYIFTPPSQTITIVAGDAVNVNFTAQLASVAVTLITPADGAQIIPGDPLSMLFSTTALAGSTVKIEFSSNSGVTWSTINASHPITVDGSNSFLWNVPNTPTTGGRIRITANAFPSVVSQNNADFQILTVYNMSGTITSGGTPLAGVTVNFLGPNAPAPVVTAANGTWSQAKFRDGVFTVSPVLPGFLFLPAASAITVTNADVTGVNFNAQPVAASLTLVTPANGSIVMPGQQTNIVFATNLLAGTDVTLEYSDDNGATWNTLTNNFTIVTDGSQTYSGWITPNSPSGTTLVQILSNAFPGLFVGNTAPFSIAQVYSVSGAVTTGTGALSGVTLSFSGPDAPAALLNDAAGLYTQNNFRDGTFTITPFKTGYLFTPPSQTVIVAGGNLPNVNFFGQPVASALTLVSPADASDLLPNQATNIIFSTTALAGTNVKIEYASDGVTFTTVPGGASIAIAADGSQSFAWTNNGVVTNQGRIRISSLGFPGITAQNVGTFNVVATFSLSGTVTTPTGPLAGVAISFSGPSAPAPVITNAAGVWSQAAFRDGTFTVVPQLGGYIFAPATRTATVTVANIGSLDFAAQPVAASLTLVTPQNGAILMPSVTAPIVFSANALIGTAATIEYSSDNGTTWVTLTNSFSITVDGSQTYNGWTTPATPTALGRIRVTSNAFAALTDANSAPFSIAAIHNISGNITTPTGPLAAVTMSFSGPDAPVTVPTDALGNYTQSAFRDGTFTITPFKTGYLFTPASKSVTMAGANLTAVDFAAQPVAAGITLVSPADNADVMPGVSTNIIFSTTALAGTNVKIEYASDGATFSTVAGGASV
ncbi:MAG TPA: carboxypeptidase-like regulatory domain-containing protein, partial [Planctomycetota bacterium]|nr:carboxypeptidase-like regulatory domain-containing protein [Planctomycetota bacterium]